MGRAKDLLRALLGHQGAKDKAEANTGVGEPACDDASCHRGCEAATDPDAEMVTSTVVIEVISSGAMVVVDCSDLHEQEISCYGCQRLRCLTEPERAKTWYCGRDGAAIRIPEIRAQSCEGYESHPWWS